MIAPGHELVKTVIDEAYRRFRGGTTGKNADYISYLAPVNTPQFQVTVVTTGNLSYSVGGDTYSFALALQAQGADRC